MKERERGREKECEKKTQSFLLQSLIFEQLRQHHCMTYIKKLQAQRGQHLIIRTLINLNICFKGA